MAARERFPGGQHVSCDWGYSYSSHVVGSFFAGLGFSTGPGQGPEGRRLVSSGDPVEDRIEHDWFVSLYDDGHEILPESSTRAVLQIGKDEQPYPIHSTFL
jgi:hypothetical protein